MEISFCNNYFGGLREIRDFRNYDCQTNAIILLKILSYFTLVIPFGFIVASLCGRVTQRQELSEIDRRVQRLNPNGQQEDIFSPDTRRFIDDLSNKPPGMADTEFFKSQGMIITVGVPTDDEGYEVSQI